MIARIIEFCVRNRWLVVITWLGIALWGLYAVIHTPVDAIPDLSENQVIVFTDWMGRSPQDIEEQITYPLSVQLQGLAGVKAVRSSSEFNFSMINIIFDESTDFYFARTRVLERLGIAQSKLPAGTVPYLAPDATALGQIFWYTVEGKGKGLDELRSIQDYVVRYRLAGVPGVAEVASVGGFVREYQVDIDPAKLRLFDLPLGAVYSAIARSNMSVGGKTIVANSSEYIVRGIGWLRGVEDLENVIIETRQGAPIRVSNVAKVQLGPEYRRSALEKNGREAVGGVVMMRYGENPLAVTERIKDAIRDLQSGLPEGVRIEPFYDRTHLIESAIHTVTGTLKEEMIIAAIAILLILAHFRSAVVVCVTLPMAVLVSFLFMYYLKIPSNIMSLCGIAISIGILVDAGVVMVENATHQLKEHFGDKPISGDTTEIVVQACRLVGRPIFFAVVIMLLSFLPVFAFGGQEGKLSHPLAYTKSFAMLGVALLSISFVPALIPLLIRGRLKREEDNWIVRSFIHIYKPMLSWVIDRPGVVWWMMAVILALGAGFIHSPAVTRSVLLWGSLFVLLGTWRGRPLSWISDPPHAGWWILAIVCGNAVAFAAVALAGTTLFGAVLTLLVVAHLVLDQGARRERAANPGASAYYAADHRPPTGSYAWMRAIAVTAAAMFALVCVAFIAQARFPKLGSEFMPSLNEGSIMDMPTSAPRIAITEALDDVMLRDRIMRGFPEVEGVVGKVGRADTATDPSPVDMVETVVTMRPREWWPKRRLNYEDLVQQAAVVAANLQEGGHLAPGKLEPGDWLKAARGMLDSEYLKYNPRLSEAAQFLNVATMAASEEFDRAMRDLARRRQLEYEPQVATALANDAVALVLEHVKQLVPRDGKPSLLREANGADHDALVAAALPHAQLIGELPRQEEVDKLLESVRKELVSRGIASDRDDLLLDAPSPAGDAWKFARQAVGLSAPALAERVFSSLDQKRSQLWVERTKTLNWELFDYGVKLCNDVLADGLIRGSKGTPFAVAATTKTPKTPDDVNRELAKHLFLWQKTKDDVLKEMDSELQMPGWGNAWTQPIINRVNMLATGVRTQIGVKVFGPTDKPLLAAIDQVQQVSQEIAAKLKTVRGAVDVVPDQAVGKRYIEIRVDEERARYYGVNMAELAEAIEVAIGGSQVTTTVEGRQRFPVRLRYARDYWQDVDAIGDVLVTARATPAVLGAIGGKGAGAAGMKPAAAPSSGSGGMGAGSGGSSEPSAQSAISNQQKPIPSANVEPTIMQIPLRMVADIKISEGPSMIKSENGRLRNYVTLNVRDRDVVGFVDEARQAVKGIEAKLAGTGMTIEWTGEFEAQMRARQTMAIIFPMVIALILLLLYMTFHEMLDTLLVSLAVLGALAGSLMFQAAFGFSFSVIVSIGYVAAFGMATQTGVIMLVYLREAIDKRGGLAGIKSLEELRTAVIEGAVHRLRPKLLTEGVAIVGLVPMLWATGTGAEIMRPMAAPVLGGLLISDEVIDLMIPVLFYWIRRRRWLKQQQQPETGLQFTNVPTATAL